jgi:hypothetical protein
VTPWPCSSDGLTAAVSYRGICLSCQEGNLGYWEAAPWAGCHVSDGCFTQGRFWDLRQQWLPSWQAAAETGDNALYVDWVRVWAPPRHS